MTKNRTLYIRKYKFKYLIIYDAQFNIEVLNNFDTLSTLLIIP